MTTHSAILPTNHHSQVVLGIIPGNPQLAMQSVKIQDVSFDDATKISALVKAHNLAPLEWEPPITVPAPVPTPAKAPTEAPVAKPPSSTTE